MRYFKITGFVLLALSVVALVLNTVDEQAVSEAKTAKNFPSLKDSVNIIIAMDWTGTITQIDDYRSQLRSIVPDSLEELIENQIGGENALNLSYSYYGLVIPESIGPNPNFKTNYVKNFRSNRQSFGRRDWLDLIDHILRERPGGLTALTVAKEMSVLATESSIKAYDGNYLILVSDDVFNVEGDQYIGKELDGLENWSKTQQVEHQKIRNISYAKDRARRFLRFYNFSPKHRIELKPQNAGENAKHFIISLFEIGPPVKKDEKSFLNYPERLLYEHYSKDFMRIPLKLEFNRDELRKSGYSPSKIVLSIPDAAGHNDLFQETYTPKKLPEQILVPHVPDDEFPLKICAYYNYQDGDLYQRYREKHEIILSCRLDNGAKLVWLWPVQGALLELHDSLNFLNGQVAIARFWNFIMILTAIFWLIKLSSPLIVPPPPKVRFAVKRE